MVSSVSSIFTASLFPTFRTPLFFRNAVGFLYSSSVSNISITMLRPVSLNCPDQDQKEPQSQDGEGNFPDGCGIETHLRDLPPSAFSVHKNLYIHLYILQLGSLRFPGCLCCHVLIAKPLVSLLLAAWNLGVVSLNIQANISFPSPSHWSQDEPVNISSQHLSSSSMPQIKIMLHL